jgi:2,3-bisphosphoglycerate-dependent phosphoglycerate mutase
VKIVFLRHGESVWNRENRFTGWTDVDLSDTGREEAFAAGRTLADAGFRFDVAYTSVLRRAIRTLWIALDALDQMWLPVHPEWRLNERHYGALQGLDKAETAAKHGEAQVKIWRRSYDIPPPPLSLEHPSAPARDPRYAGIPASTLPHGESLADTVRRVVPFWEERIVPELRAGRRVLVTAHGNSLRALVKHLDMLSDEAIVELNIPTGVPLVYTLDAEGRALSREYLGDPEVLARRVAAAAAHRKATTPGEP